MAFFDEGAASVLGDPAEVVALQIPGLQLCDDLVRMIFGNIIEVVGHGAAHGERRVILQGLQNRGRGRRVENQGRQLCSPRQPRSRAFARQPPYFFIRIQRPPAHRLQGARLIRL